jgi:hypothetical protein
VIPRIIDPISRHLAENPRANEFCSTIYLQQWYWSQKAMIDYLVLNSQKS